MALKKRKKLRSLKVLRKHAWMVFSIWVRSHDADFSGYQKCYTCERVYEWREMHAGHFRHGSFDLDRMNVKPQCAQCNTYLHGKPLDFYLHLTKEYGTVVAEILRTRAGWNNYSRQQLEEIITYYEKETRRTKAKM